MVDDIQRTYHSCRRCGGTGSETIGWDEESNPIPPITCRKCSGEGVVSGIYLSPDLIDLLNDMKNEIDKIKEKVDEIKIVVDGL